jgi:enoyl-CoA hydratase
MAKVLYERDGRIARITLNRPDVLNAIDDDVPRELEAAVLRANEEPGMFMSSCYRARAAPFAPATT